MIYSFRDEATHDLANRVPGGPFQAIEKVARKKLNWLDAAVTLGDLAVPSGNRLEKLQGDRAGQYSIRINEQYRLCFRWDNGAHDVEIVDYH
jgi:proteic killer suppression protein